MDKEWLKEIPNEINLPMNNKTIDRTDRNN